jgi:predicted MFS family arabinose efflux permease
VVGYGFVQALVPALLRRTAAPDGRTVAMWASILCLLPAAMAAMLDRGIDPQSVLMAGLTAFAVVFAVNSAVHSFLIVSWSDRDKVSMNVGFYYMANAGGRLAGTVLSGAIYQSAGITGCLWWSAAFVLAATLISLRLPGRTETAA